MQFMGRDTLSHWDARFLELARHVGEWSKDPSTRVGAVIARPDRTIASVGFNGFPRGVADTAERLQDRPTKYAMTVHAEVNAILAAREPLAGFAMYVSPLHPCSNCAAAIVQSGVSRVFAEMPTDGAERWVESFKFASELLTEAGVDVRVVPIEPSPDRLRNATENTVEWLVMGSARFEELGDSDWARNLGITASNLENALRSRK